MITLTPASDNFKACALCMNLSSLSSASKRINSDRETGPDLQEVQMELCHLTTAHQTPAQHLLTQRTQWWALPNEAQHLWTCSCSSQTEKDLCDNLLSPCWWKNEIALCEFLKKDRVQKTSSTLVSESTEVLRFLMSSGREFHPCRGPSSDRMVASFFPVSQST